MFKKYQHIENLTKDERRIEGLLDGECWIFPKLDGCNCCIWVEDGEIKAGSRNRQLTLQDDHMGFYAKVLQDKRYKEFFKVYPQFILYGEYLKPHTLKTYQDEAWDKFYVFDVELKDAISLGNGVLISYPVYVEHLDFYEIDYIPSLGKTENPTIEWLKERVNDNKFLIKDDMGVGEGIVIKNYKYRNYQGKQIWGKIVKQNFKDKQIKVQTPVYKAPVEIEKVLVDKYITSQFIQKEKAKIAKFDITFLPLLFETIYRTFIEEELFNILKDNKKAIIDFSRLHHYLISKIKQEVM